MTTLIGYGLGNIAAFVNVYRRLNIPVKVATSRSDLIGSERLILPGVGAFDYAMHMLNISGMKETIDELVLSRKIPVIGICVGMQMLAKSSEEGILPGLGYIDGVVRKFDPATISTGPRLPHMGWNNIKSRSGLSLFTGIPEDGLFYFLHSYYFECTNKSEVLTTTEYGITFHSAVQSGNVMGVQFHPEKSHTNGMQLLKNFAEIENA